MYNYLIQVVQGILATPWEPMVVTIVEEFFIETLDKKSCDEIREILLGGKLSNYKSLIDESVYGEGCQYTELHIKEIRKESLYF